MVEVEVGVGVVVEVGVEVEVGVGVVVEVGVEVEVGVGVEVEVMIILEGPDGSGKSHLAKCLRDRHGFGEIVQWNDPPRTANELDANLERSKALAKGDSLIIQDRTPWVTEPIYDVLKNGLNGATHWVFYQTGTVLLQPALVYCRPPRETIRKFATTGTSPPDDPKYLTWIGNNIDDLIGLYDLFMAPLSPIVYDWTRDYYDAFIAKISKKLLSQKL